MSKEDLVNSAPSFKSGLDDFYGKQTVINLMQSYADEQVKKALKEVLKSLPNDMDAYADNCINEAITKVLNQKT